MQLQVYASAFPFARVEVEIQLCNEDGHLIRDCERNINLRALDANTLLPVKFHINGKGWEDAVSLHVGNSGYVKSDILFDSKDTTRDIVFRVAFCSFLDMDESQNFDSEAVKLIKYRLELNSVRLTDDISRYDGDAGVHFTNNDSARIRVLYKVYDVDGILLTDRSELARFQSEVQSQFLFANGERVQFVNESGIKVDITNIDCAVKRKSKDEESKRQSKLVFEEKKSELKIFESGIVNVSYRINMFSSHQLLKQYKLAGRKYTIELCHPLALAISIPPVRILTKYHRGTKKDKTNAKEENLPKERKCVNKKEKHVFIKREKQEGLFKSDNIKYFTFSHTSPPTLNQYINNIMCTLMSFECGINQQMCLIV